MPVFFSSKIHCLLLCAGLTFSSYLLSQNNPPQPAAGEDLKKEILIGDKRYRVYNNWLSFGIGPAKNFNIKNAQFAIGIDYNFHIRKHYLQSGVLVSGDDFGSYNNVQWHLGYGKRKENKKMNFSYFGGFSYSSGYKYLDSTYSNTLFRAPGLYACVQLIAKLKYDIGLGPSIFAEINQVRSIVGIRLDFYFSSSYKGKKS